MVIFLSNEIMERRRYVCLYWGGAVGTTSGPAWKKLIVSGQTGFQCSLNFGRIARHGHRCKASNSIVQLRGIGAPARRDGSNPSDSKSSSQWGLLNFPEMAARQLRHPCAPRFSASTATWRQFRGACRSTCARFCPKSSAGMNCLCRCNRIRSASTCAPIYKACSGAGRLRFGRDRGWVGERASEIEGDRGSNLWHTCTLFG